MKSFVRSFLLAVVCLSGLGACQSQGEGEHCDQLNGSPGDCASGLACSTASICCVPGTTACNATLTGTAGAGGSGADAATHDAASETSPSEAAASEAAIDSPTSEASTTGSETSVDSGPADANSSDAAAE